MDHSTTQLPVNQSDRREQGRGIKRMSLSIAETCAAGGFGRSTAYEAIADGRLTARKLGRRTLILADDLRDFLQALPTAK
jgi:excisionase family DNA binding protein